MGAGVSQLSQLDGNQLLTQLSGVEHLPSSDVFWNKLLSFQLTPPTNSDEQLVLETCTDVYLQRVVTNNPVSGNIASLLQVFINRATELLASPNADNSVQSWQTLNALLVMRCVVKYLIENVSESVLEQHLHSCWESHQGPGDDTVNGNTNTDTNTNTASGSVSVSVSQEESAAPKQEGPIEMLVDALFGLIIDVPVRESTYYLHLEAINSLLVLLAVQLYAGRHVNESCQGQDGGVSAVYRCVFGGGYRVHSGLLVRALLKDLSHSQPPSPNPPSGSLVLGLASSLWSLVSGGSGAVAPSGVLGSQACLLLLLLANHAPPPSWPPNPYRAALLEWGEGAPLYQALSSPPHLGSEPCTLLLYLLLHRNPHFRAHLLALPPAHLAPLLVSLLQTLYHAPTPSSSHHIYMALIVLLILSEDDSFNKAVHTTMLKNVSWYTERSIPEISMGGLMVLVIVRTIQFNMLRCRDRYLHTNCLAALANMSGDFRNLHPYVAQRIVSLFEALSKKHARLMAQPPGDIEEGVEALEGVSALQQEVAALEEVLRMVLEIINSALTSGLRANVHLVYSLLHKRALFHRWAGHRGLGDLIQNVEMVVGYFSARLQRAQEQRGALGASQVLAVVTRAADHWSNDRLRKFPELKFRYVEEEQPEEFFTPYVWSLVCSLGLVRWSIDSALLPDLTSC